MGSLGWTWTWTCVVEGSENGGRSYFVCCTVLCVVFSVMDVLQVLCCVLMCVAGCVVLYSEL